MDPIEKMELRRDAQRRLHARRRRVRQLRGRAAAVSLIVFALFWGVVFARMVAGEDPVLGGSPKIAAPRIVSKAVEVEPEPEPEPEPAPVTTSQS